MRHRYEPYAYIDLGALSDRDRDERESADTRSAEAPKASCRGRTLLLLTGRGIEIVRVPEVLH
jgi:hypothetical protein